MTPLHFLFLPTTVFEAEAPLATLDTALDKSVPNEAGFGLRVVLDGWSSTVLRGAVLLDDGCLDDADEAGFGLDAGRAVLDGRSSLVLLGTLLDDGCLEDADEAGLGLDAVRAVLDGRSPLVLRRAVLLDDGCLDDADEVDDQGFNLVDGRSSLVLLGTLLDDRCLDDADEAGFGLDAVLDVVVDLRALVVNVFDNNGCAVVVCDKLGFDRLDDDEVLCACEYRFIGKRLSYHARQFNCVIALSSDVLDFRRCRCVMLFRNGG